MTTDQEQQLQQQLEGYAKYRHLKANVRRRRFWYAMFILLAIAVFAVSLVDIAYLENATTPDTYLLQYGVYAAYGLLILLAIIMLFSSKRHVEEVAEVAEMSRALLQCPSCTNVFEYGAINFEDAKKTSFSCPVCGVFSKLPDTSAEPVKVLEPEGDLHELQYHCTNCNEDLAVGTYGEVALHLVRFRACPHCGEKGFIERIQTPPPAGFEAPEPTEEDIAIQNRPPLIRKTPVARQ